MSKEKDKVIVKEINECANSEVIKSKRKHKTILCSISASIVLLLTAFSFVFIYEMPVLYSEDLIEVNIPADTGLNIKVNLPNYKNAKVGFVWVEGNTYDLYVNVSQTLATKIFNDKDKSNNYVRVGYSLVVDYQSGIIIGRLPNIYNDESVRNIYYIDDFSAKNIATDNAVLVWTRSSVAE